MMVVMNVWIKYGFLFVVGKDGNNWKIFLFDLFEEV